MASLMILAEHQHANIRIQCHEILAEMPKPQIVESVTIREARIRLESDDRTLAKQVVSPGLFVGREIETRYLAHNHLTRVHGEGAVSKRKEAIDWAVEPCFLAFRWKIPLLRHMLVHPGVMLEKIDHAVIMAASNDTDTIRKISDETREKGCETMMQKIPHYISKAAS